MPDIYTAVATLTSGMSFLAHTSTGHDLLMDSSADHGGADGGPTPMEALLAALAGCTGMDVIAMLRKMREDVTGYQVRVRGDERADAHPRIFTKITVEHVVTGRDLNAANVARAVELSSTRYCPVSAMLGKAATVVHTFAVVDA